MDPQGKIVISTGPFKMGEIVTGKQFEEGTQLILDGVEIGRILDPGFPIERSKDQERFLEQISSVLVNTAIGAIAASIVLSLLLAYTFTRPLQGNDRRDPGNGGRQTRSAGSRPFSGRDRPACPILQPDEQGPFKCPPSYANKMTADIAHDLRSPLTVITGYLESMTDGVLKPTPERLNLIHTEAIHLQRLVEDLRTLSLADAGELSITRLAQSYPTTPGAGCRHLRSPGRTKTHYPPGRSRARISPYLQIDPDRIMQVLGNLVSNALRHTPEGGQITLSASRSGEHPARHRAGHWQRHLPGQPAACL